MNATPHPTLQARVMALQAVLNQCTFTPGKTPDEPVSISCSRAYSVLVSEKGGNLKLEWRPSLSLSILFALIAIPSIVGICLPILIIALLYGIAYVLTVRHYNALKAQIKAGLEGAEIPFGPGGEEPNAAMKALIAEKLPQTRTWIRGDSIIVQHGRHLVCGLRKHKDSVLVHHGGLSLWSKLLALALTPTIIGAPAVLGWAFTNSARSGFRTQVQAVLDGREVPEGPGTRVANGRNILTPLSVYAGILLLGVLPLVGMTLVFIGEVYGEVEDNIERQELNLGLVKTYKSRRSKVISHKKILTKTKKEFKRSGKVSKAWCRDQGWKKNRTAACMSYVCFEATFDSEFDTLAKPDKYDDFRGGLARFRSTMEEKKRCDNFEGFGKPFYGGSEGTNGWKCVDDDANFEKRNKWSAEERVSPVKLCPTAETFTNDSKRLKLALSGNTPPKAPVPLVGVSSTC